MLVPWKSHDDFIDSSATGLTSALFNEDMMNISHPCIIARLFTCNSRFRSNILNKEDY